MASTWPPFPARAPPGAWPGGWPRSGPAWCPGFGVVAEAVGLADRLARADLVVTGEGRLDASSWSGKVVGGVVAWPPGRRCPVLVVAGQPVGPGGLEGAGDGPASRSVSLTDRFGAARAPAGSRRVCARGGGGGTGAARPVVGGPLTRK